MISTRTWSGNALVSNTCIPTAKCGISAKKAIFVLKAKFVVTDTALSLDSHFTTKTLASSVLNYPREYLKCVPQILGLLSIHVFNPLSLLINHSF